MEVWQGVLAGGCYLGPNGRHLVLEGAYQTPNKLHHRGASTCILWGGAGREVACEKAPKRL